MTVILVTLGVAWKLIPKALDRWKEVETVKAESRLEELQINIKARASEQAANHEFMQRVIALSINNKQKGSADEGAESVDS